MNRSQCGHTTADGDTCSAQPSHNTTGTVPGHRSPAPHPHRRHRDNPAKTSREPRTVARLCIHGTLHCVNGTLPDLSDYLSTCATVIARRAGALLYIAAAVWIPFTILSLGAVAATGLLTPVDQAINQALSGADRVVVTWPQGPAVWLTLAAIAITYLWCAATSSAAVAYQTSQYLAGTPRCGLDSLVWGVKRSLRTLAVLIAFVALAIVLFAASTTLVIAGARQLALAGVDVTAAVTVSLLWWPAAAIVFVAIYNRWSLAVTAAAVDPQRRNPLTVSWRATAKRFWAVLIRWLLVAVIATTITGTIASIAIVFGVFGTAALITAAVAVRILTTAIANAAQITALTVLYRQTETAPHAHT